MTMKTSPARKLALALAFAAFSVSHVTIATAQTSAPAATDATAPDATQKPTKAQKKEARKEARAKKNAELKKLEDAGYNPAARDDTNYPQDIQNAEKKAGIGQAPSK
jgi:hypothetical protein